MSWFSNLFGGGGSNPADAANQYISQIPGQTRQYFDPFFQAGVGALPSLQGQYQKLLSDPGAFMNQMGMSYKESPGLKNQIAQAMQGAGHAAAAGGMAGSPEHEQQNMQLSNDIASQDYNNWMNNALGLYGSGLSGQQGMAGMGMQAGNNMANMIAQSLAQQGNYAFRGQQDQNSMNSGWLSGLGQIGGAALGGLAGGPWGAFAGWNAANRR